MFLVVVPGLAESNTRDIIEAADAAHSKGQLDAAIDLYNKVIASKELARTELAKALCNRCLAKLEKGIDTTNGAINDEIIVNQAILDCTKALLLQSDYYLAYYNRANALAAGGILDRALADFNVVIALKPDYDWAYYNRGDVLAASNAIDLAINDFDHFIKAQPQHARAYYKRGSLYARNQQYEKAIADFDAAIRLQPEQFSFYQNRGRVRFSQGRFRSVIADLTTVIDQQPENSKALLIRGLAFFLTGNAKNAIQDLKAAHELDINDPYGLIWLFVIMDKTDKQGISVLNTTQLDTHKHPNWPTPLIDLYLDKMPPEMVLKKAKSTNATLQRIYQSEAFYHIGQYYLRNHKIKQSQVWFRKLLDAKEDDLLVFHMARLELQQLAVLDQDDNAAIATKINLTKPTDNSKQPTQLFAVVLGSFKEKQSVKNILAKINRYHIKTFQQSVKVNGINYIRLRAGPFNTRQEATSTAQQIKQKTGLSALPIVPF